MSVSIRTLLVDLENRFKIAKIESARTDAELIVAHVLGISRASLSLLQEISPQEQKEIERLCQLRQQRIPLQHLTKEAGFRRIVLKVGKGVFIPRPETELLVESTLREFSNATSTKMVDFCSGAGAIAISLAIELKNVHVYAVEVDQVAFEYLKANHENYQAEIENNNSKLETINSDLADFDYAQGTFDAVVANPPYIPANMIPKDPEVALHDPPLALYGGEDGLDLIRIIILKAAKLLKPGGFIAIEHAELQGDPVLGVPGLLHQSNNFESIEDRKDLNGLARYTIAKRR